MLPFSPIASTPLADDGGVSVVQYSLTADAGTFTYTSQDAVLQFGDNFVAAEGSFALTGQDANLIKSVSLSVDAGSFAVTGQAVNLDASKAVSLDAGLFTSTGQDVAFTIGFDATVDLVEYGVSVASGTNSYGTGNKFYVSGSPDASPTLRLQAGITYRFDQSDSSNSGHPFRFSTTPDGTHDSGSEYTTGVTKVGTAGSAGAYVEIEVTGSTPTLYYYCTNHSGMGGKAETNAKLFNAVGQDAALKNQYVMEASVGIQSAINVFGNLYKRRLDENAFFYVGQSQTLNNFTNVIVPTEPTVSFSTSMLAETGSFSLTGLPHNKAITEVGRHVSLSLSGQDSQFAINFPVDVDAFSSTGQDANFTLLALANAGDFDLSGQDVGLSFALSLEAESGSFTQTGQDVGISKAIRMSADAGLFEQVGQDAAININFVALSESLNLNGQDVTITKELIVTLEAASFNLVGQDAVKGISEIGAEAQYELAGQAVSFEITLSADHGSFGLSGQDALKGIIEQAPGASFNLVGIDVSFALNISMIAESASFPLAGQDARFAFVFNRAEFDGYSHAATIDETGTITLLGSGLNSITIDAVEENAVALSSDANSLALEQTFNEAA